ncbi:hypothetical protein ASD43_05770 [Microbacterium sp. Root553]|nr:hypothetical protein ASD43_05770 [Microbacterium sp. Root553]
MLSSEWPDGPSSSPAGEAARRFALKLREAIGQRSVRSVARDAGVDEGTIRKILSGQSWADFHTIWSLEPTLDTPLYSR